MRSLFASTLAAAIFSLQANAFSVEQVTQRCRSDSTQDRAFCEGMIFGAIAAAQTYFGGRVPFENYSMERYQSHRTLCKPDAFERPFPNHSMSGDMYLATFFNRMIQDEDSPFKTTPFGDLMWLSVVALCMTHEQLFTR